MWSGYSSCAVPTIWFGAEPTPTTFFMQAEDTLLIIVLLQPHSNSNGSVTYAMKSFSYFLFPLMKSPV